MYPIMLKIKFTEMIKIRKNTKPILFTVLVNWGIAPFSMALMAWIFMHLVFPDFISEELQNEYVIGLIIFGLAPCTAMTLVWTYLARANPLPSTKIDSNPRIWSFYIFNFDKFYVINNIICQIKIKVLSHIPKPIIVL